MKITFPFNQIEKKNENVDFLPTSVQIFTSTKFLFPHFFPTLTTDYPRVYLAAHKSSTYFHLDLMASMCTWSVIWVSFVNACVQQCTKKNK